MLETRMIGFMNFNIVEIRPQKDRDSLRQAVYPDWNVMPEPVFEQVPQILQKQAVESIRLKSNSFCWSRQHDWFVTDSI